VSCPTCCQSCQVNPCSCQVYTSLPDRAPHRRWNRSGCPPRHRTNLHRRYDPSPRSNQRTYNVLRCHRRYCPARAEPRFGRTCFRPLPSRIEACDIVLVHLVSLKHRPNAIGKRTPHLPRWWTGCPIPDWRPQIHAAVEAHLVPRDDRSVTIATIDRRVLRRRGEPLNDQSPDLQRNPRYMKAYRADATSTGCPSVDLNI
jgi:hypothetical protein